MATKDPLAQFRRQPAQTTTPATQLEPYEAFKAVDRPQNRLRIRPAAAAWERVTYSYLLRVVEDGDFGTEIVLVYTFMVVIIRGRNLQRIADAIDAEGCEFIAQFDAEKWAQPTDSAAPFIESIEIHTEQSPEETLASRSSSAANAA